MIYKIIDGWQKKAEATRVCRVLGISRSGWYAWRHCLKKQPSICSTTVQLKAAFAASGRSYGSRRLQATLNNQGINIGRYKVRKLMQQAQLKPVWQKKFGNSQRTLIILKSF